MCHTYHMHHKAQIIRKISFILIYISHINFCAISFNRTQNLHFLKNSGKNCDYSTPYYGGLAKIVSVSSFKVSILHAKFCTIPCNRN